jgi:hypothetical protein
MIKTLNMVKSILISYHQFQFLSNNPTKKKQSLVIYLSVYFTSAYGLSAFVTIIFGRKLYTLIFLSNRVLRSATDSNEHTCIGQTS